MAVFGVLCLPLVHEIALVAWVQTEHGHDRRIGVVSKCHIVGLLNINFTKNAYSFEVGGRPVSGPDKVRSASH